MPIPGFQDMMLPILKLAGDGKTHQMADARETLARRFDLTDEERAEQLPSGRARRFANRVAWAKSYLARAKLLGSPIRGHFVITERGREVLSDPPDRVDIAFLNQFEEFREFRKGRRETRPPKDSDTSESTPEEALEAAYERLQSDLADEILGHVTKLSPESFESLVIDLLLSMGYGGGRREAGSTTQRSSDGGIDGIIHEDRLGLDVIYLQAKKWDNPVGRPEIQRFVGALHGRRARKGVFITTSRFTPDAESYVEHIDPKVVLIDGDKLARLMVDYDVGVGTSDTLKVKKIDLDYFADE